MRSTRVKCGDERGGNATCDRAMAGVEVCHDGRGDGEGRTGAGVRAAEDVSQCPVNAIAGIYSSDLL
jgi:hypothetical protein